MTVRPVIIRDEDSLVSLLRGRRQALGISQQELDDRIGWPEAYCAKVEAPGRKYGKRVLWGLSVFLAYWAESVGLAFVLMDKAQAEALIAASVDADMAESVHTPYPGRNRRREVVQRRVLRYGISFPRQAA
jgi:predicted amidohydrolase